MTLSGTELINQTMTLYGEKKTKQLDNKYSGRMQPRIGTQHKPLDPYWILQHTSGGSYRRKFIE